jgi:hypothetical protein
MVQNLDSVPGLIELYLDERYCDRSSLLAGIVHLKNLQIFTYRTNCSDEIIAQLQQYCPHLTELDVSYSRKVTNASVQPLRAARKLKFLDLYGTGIDDEHYGLLLSELPNVANITIRRNAASILSHIAVESLDTITIPVLRHRWGATDLSVTLKVFLQICLVCQLSMLCASWKLNT